MNTNDMEAEYQRIIEICKGTTLEETPWKCVQYLGLTQWLNFGNHPNFKFCNPVHVKFALGVLEGKPVFIGNRFYRKRNGEVIVAISNHHIYIIAGIDGTVSEIYMSDHSFSWKQPEPGVNIITENN